MEELKRKDDKQIRDLNTAVSNLAIEVKSLSEAFKEHQEEIKPMYEWFKNINFTKRTIMWLLGLLSAIGGIILMYKEIFK